MRLLSDRNHQVSLASGNLVNVNAGCYRTVHQVSNSQFPWTVILGGAINIVLGIAVGLCQGKYSLAATCRVEKEMITHSDSGFLCLSKANGLLVGAVKRMRSYRSLARADHFEPSLHGLFLLCAKHTLRVSPCESHACWHTD